MKTLSLKLNNTVAEEVEPMLKKIIKPKNGSMNQAHQYYNYLQKKKSNYVQLVIESKLVRDESTNVHIEIEKLDNYDS
jgi:hypothetical protein